MGNSVTEPIESLDYRSPRQVRLGDVQGMAAISAYLNGWREKDSGFPAVHVVGSRSIKPKKGQNLIILGSSEDWFGFNEWSWGNFPLSLNGRTLIERFGERFPEEPYFIGPEMPNSRPPLDCCGVLVSRTCGDGDRTCVTLVNGAHPAAVKAVCELLAKEKVFSMRLTDLPGLDFSRGFPPNFQLLFGVWLSPDEKRSIRVRLLQFNAMQNREGKWTPKSRPFFACNKLMSDGHFRHKSTLLFQTLSILFVPS